MKRRLDFSFLSKHWLLKLLSLIIGASLWYFVVGQDQVDMIVTIPLELHNLPSDMVIANQYKKEIEVAIRGPRRLIQETRQQNISRPVDLSKATPGAMVVKNDSNSIPFPHGIFVQRVQPANITLLVDRLVRKDFTIVPVSKGKPANGFLLESLTLNPSHLTVNGPQSVLDGENTIKTSAINIEGLDRSSTTIQAHLNLNEALLKLIGETVIEASVTLKETMIRKTIRGISINVKENGQTLKTMPSSVTVEADIPEQIAQITPELSMLFRATVHAPADKASGETEVIVNGITLPGHAAIGIVKITPEKVRIIQ